ncbi:MarR family winged helix-turn-helix transcriptional regulator [Kutzneria sp. CA-103260]|uniref:MarR family winged helix-turn-helix transcriptional regulator n=1 Tax=Kutzneria sp. CA-103260 TaxID=2802641 RepID=UPI001BA644C1|nr:MarR family transcriptional regulator [Kutzneria sp. CA-103260]
MTTSSRDAVDDLIEAVRKAGAAERTLRAKALAYRLRRVAHQLELEMRRELAGHGVELWELEVLAALKRAPERRLTAGQLMTAVALTSGSVTHRITRLQDRGWVRRDPDPADGRSVLVSLTEAGWQRAVEVFDVKTKVEEEIGDVLDDDAVDVLNDALRRISHHLNARSS